MVACDEPKKYHGIERDSPTFVPLAACIFWKRANNLDAALSILFGLGAGLLSEFTASKDALIPPQRIGLVASAVGMIVGAFAGAKARAV